MFPVYTRDGALVGEVTIKFKNGYTLGEESILLVATCNDIEGKPPINAHGKVYQGHPIREKVANLSTSGGDTYYRTKGDFTDKLGTILSQYGLLAECMIQPGFPEDEGRTTINLYYQGTELNTLLVVHWYKMQSGNWEFTCYLS